VTNLMETPEGEPLTVTGDVVKVPIHPYEILTIRVDYTRRIDPAAARANRSLPFLMRFSGASMRSRRVSSPRGQGCGSGFRAAFPSVICTSKKHRRLAESWASAAEICAFLRTMPLRGSGHGMRRLRCWRGIFAACLATRGQCFLKAALTRASGWSAGRTKGWSTRLWRNTFRRGLAKTTPLEAARNNHMAFFELQRADGQLPASVKTTENGYGQIQMVVPIAATAWELAQLTGDEELLTTAYGACGRWDAWLRQYRDTRKTGLVEGFCTYDTGHDNSPRWTGIPNRCPDADARKCPPLASMPRLCPDLSATVYGGRVALAAMAKALGKRQTRRRAGERCGDDPAADSRQAVLAGRRAFYDLDAQNKFVRVRGDVISGCWASMFWIFRKKDKAIFEAVWTKQLHNPKAFWAPYPLPSALRWTIRCLCGRFRATRGAGRARR
jgi:hypothetical protein